MREIDVKKLAENIDKSIGEDIRLGSIGGASVAVMQNGKLIYKNHFSNQSIGAFTDDLTLFRMASMTKPVTSIAILMLVERGLLSLEDNIAKFFSEYSKMRIGKMTDGEITDIGSMEGQITVRHLLSHCSGIGTGEIGAYQSRLLSDTEKATYTSVARSFASKLLDFEPGTKQEYCGRITFDILAAIIEQLTNVKYDEFVKENIFDPLQMHNSFFYLTQSDWQRVTPMHKFDGGKAIVVDFSKQNIFGDFPSTYIAGGAGLASTVDDYLKFAEMLRLGGIIPSKKRLVSEELINAMSFPYFPCAVLSAHEHWGLGVRVIVSEDHTLPKGSFGWSGAYGTHFWVDPENQITAILLRNTVDSGGGGIASVNFERSVYDSFG